MTDATRPALDEHDPSTYVHDLHPYTLFAAYHLGLCPDGNRRFMNANDVAKLFGVDIDAVHEGLAAYGFSSDDVVHSDFDMATARVDVELAESADLAESNARRVFDAFTKFPQGKRDWAKELEEDARAR